MTHPLTRFIGLTALSVAVATATPALGSAPTSPAWEPADCGTFGLMPLVSALSDCGYVTVPERHSQPDGPTIQVAVVRTRSIGDAPSPDPLFIEQGGPGDTTIGIFATKGLPLLPILPRILQGRDLVFVEERGTELSRPFFACPEQTDHNLAVARDEIAPTDTQWMVACRERSLTEGINPNAFNTIENAADIYAVAEALGYDQFNYYGVSYGTLLGQYVIEQAESHQAQLRSVILDGVVTTDVDFNLASTYTLSGALRNLFAACAADAQCNAAYPNLESTFLALLDRLHQNPVPLTLTAPTAEVETTIDRDEFLLTFEPYIARSGNAPTLPKNIYQAAAGDFSWLMEDLVGSLEASGAKGMYHTVLCARSNSVQTEAATLFPAPYEQLIPIGLSESASVDRFCEILQVEPEAPFAYDNTNIPVLVLNGSYDPVTPQTYGEKVARNFETAYVYTFPGVGHGSFFAPADTPAGQCVAAIATDFLTDPQQTPDSRCLTEVKPIFVYE
ncbi:MAG: alpha/beta hydrolase [Drouetiella hepatica Uher 2000/2452]|jgi:pimeloyl-ACP methyl ester carboxylesterase|uniref:Alpha/beta hydrolase n=1 Tax=Drouetiella hepatica Uher 2000/2452 TaxID=904376 RepID=A0A951QAP3_9CYAN|nr:alpha/beta hydrolase [Drouetiella hepatica Uher 2000/2452]